MEHVHYRKVARIAAIADVCLSFYSTIILWTDVTLGVDFSNSRVKFVKWIWILSILCILFACVHFLNTIVLLLSTRLGEKADVDGAFSAAKSWRFFSVFFLLPVVAHVFFTEEALQFGIIVLTRVILVFIAFVFVEDFKKTEPIPTENPQV